VKEKKVFLLVYLNYFEDRHRLSYKLLTHDLTEVLLCTSDSDNW